MPRWIEPTKAMNKDPFEEHLEQAKTQLRAESDTGDLRGFERGVWAEIALHDERWTTRVSRFLREGIPAVPVPAMAGSVAAAVLLGVLSAMIQANAYGESRSDAMEERYVAAIHPVLRSESEAHQHTDAP